MGHIYESATELIGHTPIVDFSALVKAAGVEGKLLAKMEYFNPTGSVKDRIALSMIKTAEESGALKSGGTIIEPTSGNTGIGLASIAAAKGYKLIIVMPETMSVERRNIIKSYGAEIVLTDGSKGMSGAIAKANELHEEIEGSFVPGQFTNPANPEAHYKTTGPEIWNDTEGHLDAFVAGVGTGGTVSGTGKFLKEQNGDIQVIAMEPASSPVLSEGKSGPHMIQGIGAGFVPDTLDKEVYDEVVTVTNEDAINTAKAIAKTEGLSVGISSGASVSAALEWLKKNPGKTIVALLPDSGDRYYSTALFKD